MISSKKLLLIFILAISFFSFLGINNAKAVSYPLYTCCRTYAADGTFESCENHKRPGSTNINSQVDLKQKCADELNTSLGEAYYSAGKICSNDNKSCIESNDVLDDICKNSEGGTCMDDCDDDVTINLGGKYNIEVIEEYDYVADCSGDRECCLTDDMEYTGRVGTCSDGSCQEDCDDYITYDKENGKQIKITYKQLTIQDQTGSDIDATCKGDDEFECCVEDEREETIKVFVCEDSLGPGKCADDCDDDLEETTVNSSGIEFKIVYDKNLENSNGDDVECINGQDCCVISEKAETGRVDCFAYKSGSSCANFDMSSTRKEYDENNEETEITVSDSGYICIKGSDNNRCYIEERKVTGVVAVCCIDSYANKCSMTSNDMCSSLLETDRYIPYAGKQCDGAGACVDINTITTNGGGIASGTTDVCCDDPYSNGGSGSCSIVSDTSQCVGPGLVPHAGWTCDSGLKCTEPVVVGGAGFADTCCVDLDNKCSMVVDESQCSGTAVKGQLCGATGCIDNPNAGTKDGGSKDSSKIIGGIATGDHGLGGLQNTAQKSGFSNNSLTGIIGTAVGAILAILGIVFLLLSILGGVMWMTSAGSEERAGKAKKILGAAIMGLLIILAAYVITIFVGDSIKI